MLELIKRKCRFCKNMEWDKFGNMIECHCLHLSVETLTDDKNIAECGFFNRAGPLTIPGMLWELYRITSILGVPEAFNDMPIGNEPVQLPDKILKGKSELPPDTRIIQGHQPIGDKPLKNPPQGGSGLPSTPPKLKNKTPALRKRKIKLYECPFCKEEFEEGPFTRHLENKHQIINPEVVLNTLKSKL